MQWYIWRVLTLSLPYFAATVYAFFGVSIGKSFSCPSCSLLLSTASTAFNITNNVFRGTPRLDLRARNVLKLAGCDTNSVW